MKRFFFLTALFLWLVCLPLTAMASSNDDDEDVNISFNSISSAITSYINRKTIAPDSDHAAKISDFGKDAAGCAGSLVGFGDSDNPFDSGLISRMSDSSYTTNYSAWKDFGNSGSTAAYKYMRYGYLLKDLGLDETAIRTTGMSGRMLYGIVIFISYALASFVTTVFQFAFRVLKILNPFLFFAQTGNMTRSSLFQQALGRVQDSTFSKDHIVVRRISSVVGDIYEACYNLSWYVIIPLLIAITLAMYMFAKSAKRSADAGRKLKAFGIRFAFLVIGIPLCGIFYSEMLEHMSSSFDIRNTPGTRIIASNFVDFEGWATKAGLASSVRTSDVSSYLVSDSSDTSASGESSINSFRSARNFALGLNNGLGTLGTYKAVARPNHVYDSGAWNTNGISPRESVSTDTVNLALDLVGRYLTGTFYDASSWASTASIKAKEKAGGALGNAEKSKEDNEGTLYGLLSGSDSLEDWWDRTNGENITFLNQNKEFNFFIKNFGSQTTSLMTVNGDASSSSFSYTNAGGLSAMSLYNYLSSDFSKSNVTIYTAGASSEYAKKAHYSVTIIGGNIAVRTIYVFNVIVLCGLMAFIGISYGFGMIIRSIKSAFRLIIAIPTATLGILSQIMQVIRYTVMLVLQAVLTAGLYELACDMFAAFGSLLENLVIGSVPDATILGGGRLAAFGVYADPQVLYDSRITAMLCVAFVSFALFGVGVVAFRYRRAVLYAVCCVWLRMFRLATLPEFLPVFDRYVAGCLVHEKKRRVSYGKEVAVC